MNQLKIKTCVVSMVQTNCYIVSVNGQNGCVILDPGGNASRIAEECGKMGLKPECILLTHGHFDHMMAADELRRKFDVPIYAGSGEEQLLADPKKNLTVMAGQPSVLSADRWLMDGEELSLLGLSWKVIFTPGHTEGSVCYYIEEEGILFSGDTLFCESLGRTDFPTGSSAQILESIGQRLFALPQETEVFSGHGEPTDIGHEKMYNPAAAYTR